MASNLIKRTRAVAPQYKRAKSACELFQISPSTLWHWTKQRPGFPQPIKAGARVTLFDVAAIERYLREASRTQPA